MGKAFRISFYQIRLRSGSLRIPLIFFMVGCFILENLRPVLEFSKAVEVPVSPYAFPHLTNDFVCQMVIMAGIVLVFCDAPFEEEGSFYLLPRAGKFYWGLGQIFYIFLMALLYVLFLLLLLFFLSWGIWLRGQSGERSGEPWQRPTPVPSSV